MVMPRKLRSVKLKSIADVNNFLSKLVNQVNRDELEPDKAARLGYLCSLLMSGLRKDDLDIRLSKLEKERREIVKS
jgi:hypothetical protein